MANTCYYEGHMVGSLESIHAFIQSVGKVRAPYFYRVWRIDIDDLKCINKKTKLYEMYFHGECAWSLSHTFNTSSILCNNLYRFTEEYKCVIEMYSEEEELCFSEHLLYNKGKLEIDNTVELCIIYPDDFDNFEEYKEYFIKHTNQKHSDETIKTLYDNKESLQIQGHVFEYCDKLKYFKENKNV